MTKIKQIATAMAIVSVLLLSIVFVGCTSPSEYGPRIPAIVTGKYITSDGWHRVNMVCTDIGIYRVYGPTPTSYMEDDNTYSLIPINQTIYVRLARNYLWWDYKAETYGCQQCSCCNCDVPAPMPTSCGCGC